MNFNSFIEFRSSKIMIEQSSTYTHPLRTIFIALTLTLVTALSTSIFAQDSDSTIEALLVTGGCCHDYETQKKLIPNGVSRRININWTVVHQGGDSKSAKIPLYEDENWADGYDVVVHNECFGGVGDQAFIKRIVQPHRAGVPGVFIHCSMHSYRSVDGPIWDNLVGVVSSSHKNKTPIDVKKLRKHYITQDLDRHWNTPAGELYEVEGAKDGVTPLATGEINDDGDSNLLIWTNKYGPNNTRVFSTTLGHHNETIKSKPYMDMLTRGILWAVGQNR